MNDEFEGESLKYLDLASHRSYLLTPLHQRVYYGLAVSPDDRTVLYTKSTPATAT